MLKFVQRLALDFPGTFLQTNVKKILKSGSTSFSACNALTFFQENR